MRSFYLGLLLTVLTLFDSRLRGDVSVSLNEVPDYDWFAGTAGTACGNLAGYWDRHGFAGFYTGPTANGVAPMFNTGVNSGVGSLWATKAGYDGRRDDKPGHIDDYWTSYALPSGANSFGSVAPDPYVIAGRVEHAPDCICDFIGASQRKWIDMNGECDGNLDGFAFVYWDITGDRRTNFAPHDGSGTPGRDVPSGLRAWARWRGYDADVFSQLVDFNPNTPVGKGFTFADLKKEIDAGYPVLLWLQPTNQFSRSLNPGSSTAMPRANPLSSMMLVYGYFVGDDQSQSVYALNRGAPSPLEPWALEGWAPDYPVRGVIGFHPKPRMTNISRGNGTLSLTWEGVTGQVFDSTKGGVRTVARQYVLQRTPSLNRPFEPVGTPTTNTAITISECCTDAAFFRLQELLP